MFRFRLDGSSGVPPYLQLVQQVRQSLLLGYLRAGDRLPTVKEVSVDLAINPNTVVKAYREIERAGYAEGRPGQGTFIVATPRVASAQKLDGLRSSLVEGWLSEAIAAGLDQDEISALFVAALRDAASTFGSSEPRRTRRRDDQGEAVA
jgi:GntR family transcriptional regulator